MASTQAGGTGTGYDDQEMLRMLRGQGGGQMLADPTGGPLPYGDPSVPPPKPEGPAGGGGDTAIPDAPTPMHLPPAVPTLPTAYQPDAPGPGMPPAPSDTAPGYQVNQEVPDVPGSTPTLPTVPTSPLPTAPTPGETQPPGTSNTPTGGGAGTNWASADYSDPNNIRSYFQSQGITDPAQLDRLVNTWSTYHAQPWAKDSAYFFQRMSQEVDLGGKNGGSAGGAPIPTSGYEQDPMVKEAIRKLLERGQTMPTGEDPTIRAQFNPQDQQIQRGAARAKASAAERAFGQGQVGAGANDLASQQIDQASSQNEAGLMGNLIGTELQARRQDVVQALTFAQGEERNALQQYLANLDAILRNQGLKNQNQQYYDDLGFRIGQSATGGTP